MIGIIAAGRAVAAGVNHAGSSSRRAGSPCQEAVNNGPGEAAGGAAPIDRGSAPPAGYRRGDRADGLGLVSLEARVGVVGFAGFLVGGLRL